MTSQELTGGRWLLSPDAIGYRKTIQALASGDVNQRIPNGEPAHAAVLLEAMFRKAKADVRIFSRALATNTFGNVELIDAADRFLARRGTRLRVLLEKPMDPVAMDRHPFISSVRDVAAKTTGLCGAFELRFARGTYATETAKHMAIMDDVGFRLETNHENTQAVANFNEPGVALELAAAFDRAFSMGVPAQ
jgi:hypothetical protein